MMFSFAEMMFETTFQNDVVSLGTQAQKNNDYSMGIVVIFWSC